MDSVDHKYRVMIVLLSLLLSQLNSMMIEEMSQAQDILIERLGHTANYCLGNREFGDQEIDKYLEMFSKGDCVPLILVPGILGTRLQVQIDCEVLRYKNPGVFEVCGWNSCDRDSSFVERVFKKQKVPRKEYSLWMPTISSPMSFLGLTKNESLCFNELMGLRIEGGREDELRYQSIEGVSTKIYGESEQTYDDNQCGDSSVRNIMGLADCEFNGYGKLIDLLKQLGYKPGLTYQSLGYDFRIPTKYNQVQNRISQAIHKLYHLTRFKKVIIIGHSYGNLQILQTVSGLDSSEKDMILQVVMLGAPLGGTSKSMRVLIGGMHELSKWGLGFNYQSQLNMIRNTSVIVETLPFQYLYKDKSMHYYQQFMQAAKHQTQVQTDCLIGQYFPSSNQQCFDKVFGDLKSQQCRLNLEVSFEDCLIQFGDKKYYVADIEDILQQIGIDQNLIDDVRNNQVIQNMEYPGVNILVVLNNLYNTENSNFYQTSLEQLVNQKGFGIPDHQTIGFGDSTVNNWSTYMAIIKWLDHKTSCKLDDVIQIAEFCGSYNQGYKVTNDKFKTVASIQQQPNDRYQFYSGIKCNCNQSASQNICLHSCLINNDSILVYLLDRLFFYSQETEMQKYHRLIRDNQLQNNFINQQMQRQFDYCQNYDINQSNY